MLPFTIMHLFLSLCESHNSQGHDTVGHTWPYPDTRGQLGLQSSDQSLIVVLAWLKAAFCFSLKKSIRPRNDYTLSRTNKLEKERRRSMI
jgi:hypothetical protein